MSMRTAAISSSASVMNEKHRFSTSITTGKKPESARHQAAVLTRS